MGLAGLKALIFELLLISLLSVSFSEPTNKQMMHKSDTATPVPLNFPTKTWAKVAPEMVGLDSTQLAAAMDVLGPTRGTIMVTRYGLQAFADGNVSEVKFVWSISKTLVAMIASRLLLTQQLHLNETLPLSNDPVQAGELWNIPAFAGGYVGGDAATLRQFMTMTSDFGLEPHQPGAHCAYNNNAVHFYGTYLCKTFFADAPPVAWVREQLFALVGGNQDNIDYKGQLGGFGGGFALSARDASRLGLLLLAEGQWEGGVQLLDPDWVDAAGRSQVPSTTPASEDRGPSTFWNQVELSLSLPFNETGHVGRMAGDLGYGSGVWTMLDTRAAGGEGSLYHMSGKYGNYVIVDKVTGLVITVINDADEHPTAQDYHREISKAVIANQSRL